MKNTPKELAEIIGISETALEVYLFVLQHGELPEEKIQVLANMSSQEVQDAIKELSDHQLISQKNNPQMFFAKTILQMQAGIEKQQQLVEDIKNFVWPSLQNQDNKRFFQFSGWDAIKQVYMELLQEARKTQLHFIAFENNLVNSKLGKDFVDKYVDLRTKYEITAHVICPKNLEDESYKKNYKNKYTKIKLIKNLDIDENVVIVGNSIMSFSPNTLDGNFHRNSSKANTWRSIFWHLWND